MAARTRSIELEFSMRSIWAPIQWPRQARPTAKLLAAISTPKPTSTSTDDPALLDFVEKNNDTVEDATGTLPGGQPASRLALALRVELELDIKGDWA